MAKKTTKKKVEATVIVCTGSKTWGDQLKEKLNKKK
jgi:hypothetical protein